MKRACKLLSGAAVAACLLTSPAVFAQDEMQRNDNSMYRNDNSMYRDDNRMQHDSTMRSDDRMPRDGMQQESNGVSMYSGGVGDDDLNYIHSIENRFNLKLRFTEGNGVFLSDMPVSIFDRAGNTALSTVTKGPILLVNLPTGTYNVRATDGDLTREQKLTVGRSLKTYQFSFPTVDPRASDSRSD